MARIGDWHEYAALLYLNSAIKGTTTTCSFVFDRQDAIVWDHHGSPGITCHGTHPSVLKPHACQRTFFLVVEPLFSDRYALTKMLSMAHRFFSFPAYNAKNSWSLWRPRNPGTTFWHAGSPSYRRPSLIVSPALCSRKSLGRARWENVLANDDWMRSWKMGWFENFGGVIFEGTFGSISFFSLFPLSFLIFSHYIPPPLL